MRVGGPLLDKRIIQSSGGRRHTCAITSDNEVFSWGVGENGQLGIGDTENRHNPTLIQSLIGLNPIKISCGWGHNVLLTDSGKVFTWGFGESGCLGHGDLNTQLTPKELKAIKDIDIVDVEAGSDFTLLLDKQGNVYYCGNLESKEKAIISSPEIVNFKNEVKISKMAAGLSHCLFITENGEIYSYGWNSDGQLGIGTKDPIKGPVHISSIEEKVKLIACGRVHSVCVTGLLLN